MECVCAPRAPGKGFELTGGTKLAVRDLSERIKSGKKLDSLIVDLIVANVPLYCIHHVMREVSRDLEQDVLTEFFRLCDEEYLLKLCDEFAKHYFGGGAKNLRHLLNLGVDWAPRPLDEDRENEREYYHGSWIHGAPYDSFEMPVYAVVCEFGHGTPERLRMSIRRTFDKGTQDDYNVMLELIGSPLDYPAIAYREDAAPGESMWQYEYARGRNLVLCYAAIYVFPRTWFPVPNILSDRPSDKTLRRHLLLHQECKRREQLLIWYIGCGLAELDLPVLVVFEIVDSVFDGTADQSHLWPILKLIKHFHS